MLRLKEETRRRRDGSAIVNITNMSGGSKSGDGLFGIRCKVRNSFLAKHRYANHRALPSKIPRDGFSRAVRPHRIGVATRVIEQKVVQVNRKLCNMNKKLFK